MALLFRSVVKVRGESPTTASKDFFDAWVSQKLRIDPGQIPVGDGEVEIGEKARLAVASDSENHGRAIRTRLIETPGDQTIITTATTVETPEGAWFWLDLSRSARDAWESRVCPRFG